MRVFVTGASGYIGGSVAAALLAAGHKVVGLVRSAQKAEQVRAFGATLADATSLPIEFHDERLTSRAAELDLAGLYTRKGKKRRLDAVAAARILSGFLARETG